jgi:ADP-ribosyl-[dinitrogen reductase] hydrolase
VTASWPEPRSRHGGADEIPLPAGPGRLWLCGKHYIGPDPEGAMAETGADLVVCLCERPELEERYPSYVEWLEANAGGRAVWFPVPDLHAPSAGEAGRLLTDLEERVRSGSAVLVHCGAGIGRAGTLAAALLMRMGASAEEAVRTVAAHRPLAGPEAGAQSRLLAELAAGQAAPSPRDAPATPPPSA